MYEGIAVLKGNPTSTTDDYGNEILTYRETQVYVRTRSVYQSEFYSAAQLGIKPSMVLILSNRADYHGEKLVDFEGETYEVTRADWNEGKDEISLTLNKRE